MTVFKAILAGVSVFVLGQIFLKWVIEPIQELRKVITEILFYLANDHSIIHNAHIVDREEALSTCKNLRRLGASLLSRQGLIPFYRILFKIFRLPKRENIILASRRLSLISNSIFSKERDIYYKLDIYRIDICEALGIEDPIQGGMSKQELKDAIKDIRNQNSI
jgi:hypothetical protein